MRHSVRSVFRVAMLGARWLGGACTPPEKALGKLVFSLLTVYKSIDPSRHRLTKNTNLSISIPLTVSRQAVKA